MSREINKWKDAFQETDKNLKKTPRKAVGPRKLKGEWQKIREVWKEKRKSLIALLDVKIKSN